MKLKLHCSDHRSAIRRENPCLVSGGNVTYLSLNRCLYLVVKKQTFNLYYLSNEASRDGQEIRSITISCAPPSCYQWNQE